MLVESDRGRRSVLDVSCDRAVPFAKSTLLGESFSRMTWSDAERRGDLGTSLRTAWSAEELDSTRGTGFMLGGVGSKPQNGSYSKHNTPSLEGSAQNHRMAGRANITCTTVITQ